MVTTDAAINEMELYFKSQTLPAVFKLNAATTIHDLGGFVRRSLENLKNTQVSDRINGPRWDDLVEIRKLIEKDVNK